MPETHKEKAAAEIQALPQEVKVIIEERFTDLSELTDNVAERMSNEIPFSQALVDAVKEKDPELAEEIEKTLEAPEEKPEVEEIEEKPEIEAATQIKGAGGVAEKAPAATISVSETIEGERVSAELEATLVITPEKTDFAGSAVLAIDETVYVEIYRDPLTGTAVAGDVSVYFGVSEIVSIGPAAGGGLDTEGAGYGEFSLNVAAEGEIFSVEAGPQLIVYKEEVAFGLHGDLEVDITQNLSANLSVYNYNITAIEETTVMGGLTFTFK